MLLMKPSGKRHCEKIPIHPGQSLRFLPSVSKNEILTHLQHGPSNSHRLRRLKLISNRPHQNTRRPQSTSRSNNQSPFHIQLHAPPPRIGKTDSDCPSIVDVRAALALLIPSVRSSAIRPEEEEMSCKWEEIEMSLGRDG